MIQEEIINLSKKIGFNLIGFAQLEYFNELENILIKQESLNYKTDFQIGDIKDKTFKNGKYSYYKSAIVFGLAYSKSVINPLELADDEVYLSSYCYGNDYHKIIKEKLGKVKELLDNHNYKSEIFVDNNILDEKYLAYRAGLGFYGTNNQLINDEYGSYFFIGIILTDAVFEYSEIRDKKCAECNKCVVVCPVGAINETGILDGNKCLSYLTQKKELSTGEKAKLNRCIFGCDICLEVCPHNQNIKVTNNFRFSGIELIRASEFRALTNEEFKKIYGSNACFWRGKKVLDRNMEEALKKIDKKS